MINFVKSNGLKFEEKKPKNLCFTLTNISQTCIGVYTPPLPSTKTEFFPTFENVEILI